jgi:hypothetical protein
MKMKNNDLSHETPIIVWFRKDLRLGKLNDDRTSALGAHACGQHFDPAG